MSTLDARLEKWAKEPLAPFASELGLRAMHAWTIAYVVSLATDYRAFWGSLALAPARAFDGHLKSDWVVRLSLHPALARFLWLWPLLLLLVSLVGFCGRARVMMAIAAWFLLKQLDAMAWFSVDGGNHLVAIQLLLGSALALRADSLLSTAAANAALVLARLQLVFVYLGAGASKLASEPWRRGDALVRVFAHPAWSDGWIGAWLMRHPAIAQGFTYAALGWELAFVVLVMSPRTRRIALWSGALFHIAIAQVMGIFFFSLAMMASYAFFFDERIAEAILRKLGSMGRTPS